MSQTVLVYLAGAAIVVVMMSRGNRTCDTGRVREQSCSNTKGIWEVHGGNIGGLLYCRDLF
ncbi:Uncharacterised protein [Serratia fonticola]|nr:Uncharacterised protein [Serratia fonticola]CAI1987503.1 Uncharacterised protein [Serratia fonticola]